MAANTTPCPQCHSVLKLSRQPRPGQAIRCPQCGTHFPYGEGVSKGKSALLNPVLLLVVAGVGVLILLPVAAFFGFFLLSFGHDTVAPAPPVAIVDKVPVAPIPPPPTDIDTSKKITPPTNVDISKQLVEGRTAIAENRFNDAITYFTEAIQLQKDSAEAAQGLKDTVQAQLVYFKKLEEDREKINRWKQNLEMGEAALGDKKFARAVVLLTEADKLAPPGDMAASQLLTQAKKSLEQDQQQKIEEALYQKHVNQGNSALKGERYGEAKMEFDAALKLVPDSPTAMAGLRLAEQGLSPPQTPTPDPGKQTDPKTGQPIVGPFPPFPPVQPVPPVVVVGPDQIQLRFTGLINQANTAMLLRRYPLAIDYYQQALLVIPGEPVALAGLVEARRLLQIQVNDFNYHMRRGDQAMSDKRYKDAVAEFRKALRIIPDEPVALQRLRQAERALDQDGDQTRKAAYFQAMKKGAALEADRKYQLAEDQYEEALRLYPNDTDARQSLERVRRLINPGGGKGKDKDKDKPGKKKDKSNPSPTPSPKLTYAEAMTYAQIAMQQGQYYQVIQFCQAALMERPTDALAQKLLMQAQSRLK